MTGILRITVGLAIFGTAVARADILVTPAISYTGDVVRADCDNVTVKSGENEFTVHRADIQRVDLAKPEAFEKGMALARAGKQQEALMNLKPLVDRYAGVPLLPWVEESMCQYGETLVALKDYAGAKKVFDRFKQCYPKSGRVQVLDAKYARILFEQKEPEKAIALIKGVVEPMLKKQYLTEDQETGVAEGLVLLGDCQVATGKKDDALDNYLRVIALFDVDTTRTSEAKYKSAKLLEQHGNWRHAKQNYEELLKDTPEVPYAEDAKKQLAELSKAHPE